MTINEYLIITEPKKRFGKPGVRIVKTLKAKIPANAIALKLNLTIPDTIFKKPQLEATIKINEEDISKPLINAKVLDNIREVMKQQLGVEVSLSHVQPDLELANYNVEMKKFVKGK